MTLASAGASTQAMRGAGDRSLQTNVTQQAIKGEDFWTDVVRDGRLLHERPGHPLAQPAPPTAAEATSALLCPSVDPSRVTSLRGLVTASGRGSGQPIC